MFKYCECYDINEITSSPTFANLKEPKPKASHQSSYQMFTTIVKGIKASYRRMGKLVFSKEGCLEIYKNKGIKVFVKRTT